MEGVQCNQPAPRGLTSTPKEIFLYEILRVSDFCWQTQMWPGEFEEKFMLLNLSMTSVLPPCV